MFLAGGGGLFLDVSFHTSVCFRWKNTRVAYKRGRSAGICGNERKAWYGCLMRGRCGEDANW
jgi:hypothetical protein